MIEALSYSLGTQTADFLRFSLFTGSETSETIRQRCPEIKSPHMGIANQ